MKKINDIRNYILEREFKITILQNKVNIVNYKKLINIESNKIELSIENGIITVFGEKLVVNKLLSDEILISGVIKKLEIR